MCLNDAEYDWICRYIPKNRVLNMPERPQGNILEFLIVDTLKYTFWMANLTQRWTQSGPFFPKSGYFFWFSKRGKVVHLWVWLNMHQYPWICLNILLCQGSEYAGSSYMFDKLLKIPRVLNKPGFWMWHGCICKSYAEFQVCLIMTPYAS